MKTALVFGASGNIGSYLTELLVAKGYDVVGTFSGEWNEARNYPRNVKMVPVNFKEPEQIRTCIEYYMPDEVYNMAAKMFAPASWKNSREYYQVNALAVCDILETLYRVKPEARYFQAGSAEVLGKFCAGNFTENSIARPDSPYGLSKYSAQELVRVYREHKNRFACTGILFNAESTRRNNFFFVPKLIQGALKIKNGGLDKLNFGKLHAKRDWGLAEEYAEAIWLMLQAKVPRDYVIATGKTASCLDFVNRVVQITGIDVGSIYYEPSTNNDFDAMYADPGAIQSDLGWKAKTVFPEIVNYLVEAEIKSGKGITFRQS